MIKGINRKVALSLACVLTLTSAIGMFPEAFVNARENSSVITLDGKADDWKKIAKLPTNTSVIKEWSVCTDDENMYLYVESQGNQWNNDLNNYVFEFGNGTKFRLTGPLNGIKADKPSENMWYADIPGASIKSKPSKNGGYYIGEVSIPLSFIGDYSGVSISLYNNQTGMSVAKADIPNVSELETSEPQNPKPGTENPNAGNTDKQELPEKPVYSGIKVDGNFQDWDSDVTPKIAVSDNDRFTETSAVWDGDFLYIYVKENEGDWEGNINNSTPNANGNFVIQTSKNDQTVLQIHRGSDGQATIKIDKSKTTRANIKYGNHMYEMMIPAAEIRGIAHAKYLNFGIYNASDAPELYIKNIRNLSGDIDEESTDGFKVDGDFSEWNHYAKQTIDYTTAGTNNGRDASGALFFNTEEGRIYGHVLEERNTYFQNDMTPFTIRINGDDDRVFAFSARQIDANGNVVCAQDYNLAPGTYKFALVDQNYPLGAENSAEMDWSNMVNIYHKNAKDWYMGDIIIQINQDGSAESEFYLDADRVAARIKNASFSRLKPMQAKDMQKIEARFQDIGDEWIGCAGASTGPVVGIILCVAVVVITLYSRKKKNEA